MRACALCISEVEQQPIFELRNAKTYSAIFTFCGPFKYGSELLVRRVVFIEDYPSLVTGDVSRRRALGSPASRLQS